MGAGGESELGDERVGEGAGGWRVCKWLGVGWWWVCKWFWGIEVLGGGGFVSGFGG